MVGVVSQSIDGVRLAGDLIDELVESSAGIKHA